MNKPVSINNSIKKSFLIRNCMHGLPLIIAGNFFSLLISTIDGIVVSRFMGNNALNSVNLLQPYILFFGAVNALIGVGVCIVLSKSLSSASKKEEQDTLKTAFCLAMIMLIIVLITIFPTAKAIIESYNLPTLQEELVWQYSYGMLAGLVISIISNMGTNIFIATGKAKILFILSMMEASVNLVLDIIFVGPMDMGVAGAGYATAICNVLRAAVTVFTLQKQMHLFPLDGKWSSRIAKEIFSSGLYCASFNLFMGLKSYAVNRMIMDIVGVEGFTAFSASYFLITLGVIVSNSVIQTMQPVFGIFINVKSFTVSRKILKSCLIVTLIIEGVIATGVIIRPEIIFLIHGLRDMSIMQGNIIRCFAVFIIFSNLCAVICNYMSNYGMKWIAAASTAAESMVLLIPLAFLLYSFFPLGFFVAFPLSSAIVLAACLYLQHRKINRLIAEDNAIGQWEYQLSPNDGALISEEIIQFALKCGFGKSIAYKLGLCAEEFAIHEKKANEEVITELFIKVYDDHASFFSVNNGKSESLIHSLIDENEMVPIVNSFYIIKTVSSEYDYRELYGLNVSSMEFHFEEMRKI